MRPFRLILLLCLTVGGLRAAPIVFYDGASHASPTTSGYLLYAGNTTATPGPGYTQLSSAANGAQGGWAKNVFNPFYPSPARNVGWRMGFEVQVLSESHASTNRAGFSVIGLSSDLWGVELGFWTDEIWAQNVGFTHGEGVAKDTTAKRRYDLYVYQSGYELHEGGGAILTGALRQYSGNPVYSVPSFSFFGDDTTSAMADVKLSYLDIELDVRAPVRQAPAVPEPGTLALLAGGLVVLRRRRR